MATSNITASDDARLVNNVHARLLEGSGFIGSHSWDLLDNSRTWSCDGPDTRQGVARLLEKGGCTRCAESGSSVRGDGTSTYSWLLDDLDTRLLNGSGSVGGGYTWLLQNGCSWRSEGGGPVSGHNSGPLDDSGRRRGGEGRGPVCCHTGNLLDNGGTGSSERLDAGEGVTGLLHKGPARCGKSSSPVGSDGLSGNGVHDGTAWSRNRLVSGNSGSRSSKSNSRSVMNDSGIMAM